MTLKKFPAVLLFTILCVSISDSFAYQFTDSIRVEWAQKYSFYTSFDKSNAVATDASGNIYVTGQTSELGGQSFDYLTIKYDEEGNVKWMARYNGPGNQQDIARDIAVDGEGNVFVTGSSMGINTSLDFATIKYDANGVEQWIVRYNGTGNSSDGASAVVLDIHGNIYVTGSSDGINTDFLTIKYNQNGDELWTARYDNGFFENASDISIDGLGNVYITGTSSFITSDYLTIKYSSSGEEQWVNYYNGPGNSDDEPSAIVVDVDGNAFVTGYSNSTSAWESEDFATIKYSTDGNQLWVSRFNGQGDSFDYAKAITLDRSGNVYVAGSGVGSGGTQDYITIKYDNSGNQLWMSEYNGLGNDNDYANNIIVDSAGNCYVTGSSTGINSLSDIATVKYDNSGNEQWTVLFNGSSDYEDCANAAIQDITGNVIVTGFSSNANAGYDYTTLKYDTNGNQIWNKIYDGPGNSNGVSKALAIDNAGNIYICGSDSGGISGNSDYHTIKYDSTGNMLWAAHYNGQENLSDIPEALAVDINGNVYVTGAGIESGTLSDYVTIKYDTSGNQLWQADYDGTGGYSTDIPSAISVDASGNVYVTGSSGSASSDIATIKYDTYGNQLWVARYNGSAGYKDQGNVIKVDGSGNIYVAGYAFGNGTSRDYITIKYDNSGNQLWASVYNGPANNDDEVLSLAVDNLNNVYVTGYSTGNGTARDYATIKYDQLGNQVWVERYDGLAGGNDEAKDIDLDENNNVYVTGYSTCSGTYKDYLTIKYNSAGNQIWTREYNSPDNSDDIACKIKVKSGIYVAGNSINSLLKSRCTSVKYDTSGNLLWINRYNSSEISSDKICDMLVDDYGNYIITGSTKDQSTKFNTVRFTQSIPTPVELISLTAKVAENKIILCWCTATEINNKGFEIERKSINQSSENSYDGWEKIGFVPGGGTSTTPLTYSFSDNNISNGGKHYRLKQINFDGTYHYSQEIEIDAGFTPKQFVLYQNYPNPFNALTTIKYAVPVAGWVRLNIYNLIGEKVTELFNNFLEPGCYSVKWNAINNSSGIYFCKMEAVTTGRTIYNSVIKLLLMK